MHWKAFWYLRLKQRVQSSVIVAAADKQQSVGVARAASVELTSDPIIY